MATDDVMTIDSPCMCGQGHIRVTQTSPDHPWVRASQITYDGILNCSVCIGKYEIENGYGGSMPRLVLREQAEEKAAAEAKVRDATSALVTHGGTDIIKAELVALLEAESTKAAKHRLLARLGFHPPSYATFIKQATDSRSLLKRTPDITLIRAGLRAGVADASKFASRVAELEKLQTAAYAVKVDTVKTGATWMRA